MPLSKLAAFMDVSDSELLSLLMAAKCKLKNSTDNYDETNEDFLHPEVYIVFSYFGFLKGKLIFNRQKFIMFQ